MKKESRWRHAISFSLAIHLTLAGLLAFGLVEYKAAHPEVEYVIDLDMYEAASGAAAAPENLFPEPLTAEETHSRLEQAASVTTTPTAAPLTPADVKLTSGVMSPAAVTAAGIPDSPQATSDSTSKTAEGATTGAGNSGSGGNGNNSTGDGNANGSGNGNGAKTDAPTTPFNFAGFADRVEANKNYPYQAVKRGLEGAVTMRIVLDSAGSLVSCTVITSAGSLLDNAATSAVRASCPYPNPTGSTVAFTTTLHFILN